jgi:hypothetical protein
MQIQGASGVRTVAQEIRDWPMARDAEDVDIRGPSRQGAVRDPELPAEAALRPVGAARDREAQLLDIAKTLQERQLSSARLIVLADDRGCSSEAAH